jgi:thiol-disulfide isomerase/thioredoxin
METYRRPPGQFYLFFRGLKLNLHTVMKHQPTISIRRFFLLLLATFILPGTLAPAAYLKVSEMDLREHGVFGFPQTEAKVLCDNADLRFSVWNNAQFLYAQAVLWKDPDPALGKTDDGRTIGDNSNLMLDVDADGKATANVDRTYLLNPWPEMTGMYHQICLGAGSTTHIMDDTAGRGAIRYIQTPEGKIIRVDVFVIPLAEISKHVSDKIRLCYYGDSPLPPITVNSGGYERPGKKYYSYHIPCTNYQEYVFTSGGEFNLDSVPDGRHDPSLAAPRHAQPMPKVGTLAPEISAKDWLNQSNNPTLAALRGQVVLVEFWATWCGPCLECIPHLNELQKKYGRQGFKIFGFTEQNRPGIEKFVQRTPMNYAIGLESDETFDRYGVSGIPQAFLVDRAGKIVWEGNSGDTALEGSIKSALEKK